MGRARKARKYAEVKRLINPKEIKQYRKDVLDPKKPDSEKDKLPRNVPNVSSALFFKHNTALGPPYQVLVDTNFINFSISNKVRSTPFSRHHMPFSTHKSPLPPPMPLHTPTPPRHAAPGPRHSLLVTQLSPSISPTSASSFLLCVPPLLLRVPALQRVGCPVLVGPRCVAVRVGDCARTLVFSVGASRFTLGWPHEQLDLEKAMMDCLYAKFSHDHPRSPMTSSHGLSACLATAGSLLAWPAIARMHSSVLLRAGTPCITDCVLAELEKLGQMYRVALRIAKSPSFLRLPCSHAGTYADDCLVQRVTQHKCYIVATCDRDLKRRIRKVPGVPIMYITQRKYSIERMPEATIGGGTIASHPSTPFRDLPRPPSPSFAPPRPPSPSLAPPRPGSPSLSPPRSPSPPLALPRPPSPPLALPRPPLPSLAPPRHPEASHSLPRPPMPLLCLFPSHRHLHVARLPSAPCDPNSTPFCPSHFRPSPFHPLPFTHPFSFIPPFTHLPSLRNPHPNACAAPRM
ncbi:unnamed protein product [Closterium sp. NIES-65]|nr:unnamed protein product [Closterium sp. NIES-65]